MSLTVSLDVCEKIIRHSLAKAPHRTIGIWSPPGIGKSSMIRKICEDDNRPVYDIRLSQVDAVELSGVPSVVAGRTTWNPPNILPYEEHTCIFLDELTSAQRQTMAAAYQLCLDRKHGGYACPKDTWVIAAGNLSTDRSIATPLPAALSNRMLHIKVEEDLDQWIRDFANPRGFDSRLIAFLRLRPGNFLGTPGKEGEAYPTPRSWEYLQELDIFSAPEDLRVALAASAVGPAVGGEFVAVVDSLGELPKFAEILSNPMGAKVPDSTDAKVFLTQMLAKNSSLQNFRTICEYARRVSSDFESSVISEAVQLHPELRDTQQFKVWMNI